jgi:hypothetical protein
VRRDQQVLFRVFLVANRQFLQADLEVGVALLPVEWSSQPQKLGLVDRFSAIL